MANKLVLKGSGIEVQYTIGGNPSLPALTFKEGAVHKSFTPAQIKTDDTSLGQLVSVPLTESIDVGGSRFGFFLPAVQVASGRTAAVSMAGAIETFSGPDSVPHRATTWRSVSLHGTAQEVIVPLSQPVAVPV